MRADLLFCGCNKPPMPPTIAAYPVCGSAVPQGRTLENPVSGQEALRSRLNKNKNFRGRGGVVEKSFCKGFLHHKAFRGEKL